MYYTTMHVYMYVQASTYTHSSTCVRHFASQSSKNRNYIIFVFVLQVNGVTKFGMRKGFSQSTHVIITTYCTCTGLKVVLVHVHKRQLIKMLRMNVCVC